MTTEKVQSSDHDRTTSATVHSWRMTANCSMYVQKPLESLHISTNNIDRNAAGWTKDAWFTEYAATAILKPNRQW